MLIEFKLTVLKSTGSLNSIVIGRLMNHTLFGARFRLLIWKSPPPPPPLPPPPPPLHPATNRPTTTVAWCPSRAIRFERDIARGFDEASGCAGRRLEKFIVVSMVREECVRANA